MFNIYVCIETTNKIFDILLMMIIHRLMMYMYDGDDDIYVIHDEYDV
jgi:hypothetical protein